MEEDKKRIIDEMKKLDDKLTEHYTSKGIMDHIKNNPVKEDLLEGSDGSTFRIITSEKGYEALNKVLNK